MRFGETQLTHWMELVRTHDDAIEAFWPSQIKSKSWIADKLEFQTYMDLPHSCVIFGCWYGVLADMLRIPVTVCVDKERKYLDWCEKNYPVWQGCLSDYDYNTHLDGSNNPPDLVINTITEHISQEVYDKWFEKIPEGTYYIIQGNNDYSHKDHVRACEDLNMFASINKMDHNFNYLDEVTYEGPWNMKEDKPTYYKRFMGIGKK